MEQSPGECTYALNQNETFEFQFILYRYLQKHPLCALEQV